MPSSSCRERDRLLGIGFRRGEHGGAGIGGCARPGRAHQAVDRQARRLAGDVPERDVDGADGPPGGVAVARRQPEIELLPVERVLAHHLRLEEADERLRVACRTPAGGAEEGMALHAVIGAQRQQAELATARKAPRMLAVGGRRDVVPGEKSEGYIVDLHGAARPPAILNRSAKRLICRAGTEQP